MPRHTVQSPYITILYFVNLPYFPHQHVPQHTEEAGLSYWDLPLGALMHTLRRHLVLVTLRLHFWSRSAVLGMNLMKTFAILRGTALIIEDTAK